jgi:quercetin dioxygenase-like cupin family protein
MFTMSKKEYFSSLRSQLITLPQVLKAPRMATCPKILKRTEPNRKERHMKLIQTSKLGMPRFVCTFICAFIVATVGVGSGIADDKGAKATVVYDHVLPNVPGKSMKGILVEYGPGEGSPAHIHPKSAFTYATVLEGAVRTSVNDGPAVVYKAGQNFAEMPGDRHTVDENASKTEPAKMLAVMVVDTDTKEPLLTPIHNHK